jgi:hypothetical protein
MRHRGHCLGRVPPEMPKRPSGKAPAPAPPLRSPVMEKFLPLLCESLGVSVPLISNFLGTVDVEVVRLNHSPTASAIRRNIELISCTACSNSRSRQSQSRAALAGMTCAESRGCLSSAPTYHAKKGETLHASRAGDVLLFRRRAGQRTGEPRGEFPSFSLRQLIQRAVRSGVGRLHYPVLPLPARLITCPVVVQRSFASRYIHVSDITEHRRIIFETSDENSPTRRWRLTYDGLLPLAFLLLLRDRIEWPDIFEDL